MRISDWSSDVCSSDLWTTAMDAGAAAIMRGAMLGVVTYGTASRLSIPGFEVGGKTGTAQPGTDPPRSHAWITGYHGPPGQADTIAVAELHDDQARAHSKTAAREYAAVDQAITAACIPHPHG